MKLFVLTILFIISNTYIISQEKVWSIDDCMKYAIENSPKINKQLAQNKIYYQNYLESIGSFLPSLNVSSGANLSFGRGLDAETNTYTNISTFSNNYGIQSSITLFKGLSTINNLKIEKINRLIGKEFLEEIKDIIAYETMECFLNVLYVKEIYKLSELQLEESQKYLKQIKRMEEMGIKGNPDVAELEAKEAADNYNFTRQKNILDISVIRLKEKMNYPINENITLSEYNMLQNIDKINESVQDIYNNSLSFYPKILYADYKLRTSELAYSKSIGNTLPRLSLDAGFSTGFSRYMDNSAYQTFKEQLRNKQGYYVGISVSIPVFNGFYYASNIKRCKEYLFIAQNEREETLNTLYAEIAEAIADMNGQADEFKKAEKLVEAMHIAHDVNMKKYDQGLINAIELNTSANRLLSAQIEKANAKYIFWLKYKLVSYYKGEPFIN